MTTQAQTPKLQSASEEITMLCSSTMRAITQDRYGSAEVLRISDVPVPSPGKNEVLVEVQAAGVDRGVWHLMTGKPMLVRLGFGLRRPRQATPGFDVAGTVVAVGSDVSRFAAGDEVFGIGKATFAEYAVAPADKLVHKPTTLTWEQAGAATISGITAHDGLVNKGELSSGQRVLVLGASGGVGSFAVQIASALGAEVVGVASAAKAAFVESLGASVCLDYAAGPLEEIAAPHGAFDLIFDCGGNNSIRSLRNLLTREGTLVITGGEEGGAVTGGFGRGIRAAMVSPFISQELRMFLSKEGREFIEPFAAMLASGAITTAVDRSYPLAEAHRALADLEAGSICGKAAIVTR
jgi:NADPH:quinone reductase-like Zn-dependent oxidoreductase